MSSRRTVDGAPGRARGEAGIVGGVEMLPLGLLVFVAGALVVANLWALVDTKLSVSSAAREAVRTFVEAPDATSGASAAEDAAGRVAGGSGRDPGRVSIEWAAAGRDELTRCARVVATVRYDLPALSVPWLGAFGRSTQVWGTATELVDPYRDGIAGAACGG
jgi:hypothetical protein